jgi:hypothetical protein
MQPGLSSVNEGASIRDPVQAPMGSDHHIQKRGSKQKINIFNAVAPPSPAYARITYRAAIDPDKIRAIML